MNAFSRSISLIFKGVGKAFRTFPATIAFSLAFSLVTMVRIHLEWPQQEPLNFLFGCLHWSFALGAFFSLAVISAERNRIGKPVSFLLANLLGVAAAAITFLALYLPGGYIPEGARIARLPTLSAARVGVGILISLIVFVLMAGNPKDQSDFAHSTFMTIKAFFIALIYGLVIMGGVSGVAGAVQTLLYRDLSVKVYQYLGTFVGFLAFAIFVGYFPDFRKGQDMERREIVRKQPRFIEILFGVILIPIFLGLTAVLLLWTGRILLTGEWPVFTQLSGIAANYALGGILLHILVAHHDTALAKIHRFAFPLASLIILAFEAWALINRLRETGLKTDSYLFGLIWMLAVTGALLLLILRNRAHAPIAIVACILALLAVLPFTGYQVLPVSAQINRLETSLTSQGMLTDDDLSPASTMPDQAVRERITDAVDYLSTAEKASLPVWFDRTLAQPAAFKAKLGFEKTWPKSADYYGNSSGPTGTSLSLKTGPIDIRDYGWAVNVQGNDAKQGAPVMLDGGRGAYAIYWNVNTPSGIPSLKVELDGREILNKDLNEYIDSLSKRFPLKSGNPVVADFSDMSLSVESAEVRVLLVFNFININVDPGQDRMNYGFELGALYFAEKQ